MDIPENKRAAILESIYANRKIEAIKQVRKVTGCGLAEAKQFVEKLGAELYEKEPQKFAAPPKAKGCVGLLVVGALLFVAVGLLKRILA